MGRNGQIIPGIAVSAVVVLQFILGIGLALLLTGRFSGKGIVVAIVITPLMMAPVVVGQAWRMLWDRQFGAVNHILSLITGQEVTLSVAGRSTVSHCSP